MSKSSSNLDCDEPTIMTVKDMTYVEASACHTAAGKRRCDWCKKPAKYFVRQNVSVPGMHVSIAPKCVVCAGVEQSDRKHHRANAGK